MIGCQDIVTALRALGQITAQEEARALAYLSVRENRWPHEVNVPPGAIIYLDNVSISYLQHLDLLEKLTPAGFRVFVPKSEVDEGDALVSHAAHSEDARQIIESIRSKLSAGLVSGKVRLAPLARESLDNDVETLEMHPSSQLFAAAKYVDAFVVDDRFINKFPDIKTDFGTKPVLTTFDLIEAQVNVGSINQDIFDDILTKLRLSGLMLIPNSTAEITRLISSASVRDDILHETAELRAVREAVLRVRMTDLLQLPEEINWLRGLYEAILGAIRNSWNMSPTTSEAAARSDWLIGNFDYRGWSHRLPTGADPLALFRSQMLVLLSIPDASSEKREAYWKWLSGKIIAPLKDEDPTLYQSLVDYFAEFTTQSVEEKLTSQEPRND